MRRTVGFSLLLSLALVLSSCSSSSKPNPGIPTPNIAGSWEFILVSSTMPGYATGMEVALQEGQTFDANTGRYDYTGQLSATGPQINFVGFTPSGSIVFGGNCAPAADNTGNSLTGTVSGVGGPLNFTFTENGNVFNVSANLDASGTLIDGGTYTSQSGSGCADSGTIASGQIVPKLAGTYAGKLQVNGNTDDATATLSESSGNVTVNLVLTGADNTSLTLTGPVTGNAFFVQGIFDGSTIAYYGYYEVTGNLPSLYFSSTATPALQAGLLKVPQL